MVEQPARRGDHDLRTLAQPADLLVEADAAVDGGRHDRPLPTIGSDALLDLQRELTRRGEHEHTDRATAVAVAVALVEVLEDGQHECGRLAGARLGAREQVATGKDMGNGFALHWRGLGVALLRNSAE